MTPRTRKAALYAIGMIAIAASVKALAHSYAGLYQWAVHHRLGGWQEPALRGRDGNSGVSHREYLREMRGNFGRARASP